MGLSSCETDRKGIPHSACLSPFFTSVFLFLVKKAREAAENKRLPSFAAWRGMWVMDFSIGVVFPGQGVPLQLLEHVILRETLNKLQMFLISQQCCPSSSKLWICFLHLLPFLFEQKPYSFTVWVEWFPYSPQKAEVVLNSAPKYAHGWLLSFFATTGDWTQATGVNSSRS